MQYGKRGMKLFLATGLVLAIVMSIPPFVSGQDFPNKPVTFYVGYAAGGTCDLTTRAIATAAEKLWGVPVLVENKAGAAGTVAASLVAVQKPDGYTLAVAECGTISTTPLLLKVNYDPQKDFTPIISTHNNNAGICVLSESPVKNVDDFIAYAKAHPGMSYSSSGVNSIFHIATELFAHSKGLKFKHIPYKGGAEAATALLGKHLDFLAGTGSHLPYVEQGKFRSIVSITTNRRYPDSPDVPTLREVGSEDLLPGHNIFIGPKGIPDPVLKKLNATFKKICDGPEFQAVLQRLRLPYDYMDTAQMMKHLPIVTEEYKRALSILGITLKKE